MPPQNLFLPPQSRYPGAGPGPQPKEQTLFFQVFIKKKGKNFNSFSSISEKNAKNQKRIMQCDAIHCNSMATLLAELVFSQLFLQWRRSRGHKAKAKGTKKIGGQGQGQPFRG